MPEVALGPDTRILRNPASGELRAVPVETSLQEVARTGEHFATLDEISAWNQKEKYGTAGQTALAAGEKALRTATVGAVTGVGSEADQRARAEQLNYYHPGVAFAAESAGALAPALATGGAAGAAGLAGTAVGAAAEGAAAGLGAEASSAFENQTQISAGNVALAGLGGALFGHAIPSVIRRGAGALAGATDATAAAAGEAGANVGPQLETASTARANEVLADVPPGATREAVIKNGADVHLEKAATDVKSVTDRAGLAIEKSDLSNRDLKPIIAQDAPAQTEWATRTAEDLRKAAAPAPTEPVSASPVNLGGKSVEDLKGLPIEGDADRARVDALKENKQFAETGRVASNDGQQGITVVQDGDQLVLRDGRHRLTAAQELDRPTVWGRVVDGESGKEVYQGEIPIKGGAEPVANDVGTPATIQRAANGARVAPQIEAGWTPEKGSPIDFNGWDPDDFNPGKGKSRVVTRSDYGGSDRLSKYQRGLVDEIKEGQDFIQTGRLANAKNEPTFQVNSDGTITLHHGKTRLIAAREMGREDMYGRVVIDSGRSQQVAYEGMIPVGKGRFSPPETGGMPGAGPSVPANDVAYAPALRAASDSLLESKGALDTLQRARQALTELRAAGAPKEVLQSLETGVKDASLWGRAADAVADFERSGQGIGDLGKLDLSALDDAGRQKIKALADVLEDRAAARNKWSGAGGDATGKKLLKDAQTLRHAVGIADEVAAAKAKPVPESPTPVAPKPLPAEPAPKASGDTFASTAAHEAVRYLAEHAVGHAIPGFGLAAKVGKMLWGSVDSNGQAMIQATARRVARGALNAFGEGVSAGGAPATATALDIFRGDHSGPQESFASKKGMLLEMMRDPTVLPHAMGESFGDLPKTNPQLFQDLSARMLRATSYVSQNLPAGISTSLMYPRGVPPSTSALRDFALVWNSAMDPATVLADVAQGKATPAQIKTLQAVDPDVYQTLLASVTTEIGQNYQQASSQTKQWLDILFQGDGLAGPGFSWRAAEYIQEGQQKQPNTKPPPSALPPPGKQQSPNSAGLEAIKSGVTNRGA